MNDYFTKSEIEFNDNCFNVRELSVKERRDIVKRYEDHNDATLLSAELIAAGCEQIANSDAAMELPGSLFKVLSEKIADLSGMSPETEGEEGNAEG